jgi:hypothetical protein
MEVLMRRSCDRSTPREEHAVRAQRALRPLVGVLEGVEEALDCLLDDMPDAPEELLAPHAPADFLLEVEGGIHFLLNDDLRRVIAALKLLSTLTYADFAHQQETARLRQVH